MFPQEPTTKDLSDLPAGQGFPSYCSSMAGSNMVSEKNPHFSGQGTDSEASHDVVAADVDWVGNIQKAPVFTHEVTPPASDLETDEKGTGYSPAPCEWKEL